MSRTDASRVSMGVDRETELDLVGRLRTGDTAAFDAAYDAYRPRVFGFLLRLARRPDVAEDLLEEVWLRLVTHADRLAPDTRLAAWLFTVARNAYWSYCRSRLLEEQAGTSLIGLWPAPSSTPSPYEETAGHELDRRMEQALVSLPASYREVLLLVAVEGMSPAEAARACGITPEAGRKRLSRARAMLSTALRDGERRPRSPGGDS
jgi:RNA polymerase sigma-70 factor (ECF subfamily)